MMSFFSQTKVNLLAEAVAAFHPHKQQILEAYVMNTKLGISSLGAVTVCAMIVIAATLFHSPGVQARSDPDDRDPRIEQGFDIAPVPLNLEGKDRELVGLGSYLVNAVAGCNDCHGAGPQTQFLSRGKPLLWRAHKDQSGDVPGWWPRLRPVTPGTRLSAHCVPQFNPGQNRTSGRRTSVLGVSANTEDRSGSGSRPSTLLFDRDY